MSTERKMVYRRNLPHIQPALADFFITYRLAGSLPIAQIQELKTRYALLKQQALTLSPEALAAINRRYFLHFDACLDANSNEPHWLAQASLARTVLDSLLFQHEKHYLLWCACVMPNHVHTVLSTLAGAPPLDVILQNHKKFTALHCNRLLGRGGQFWTRESYDRIIRNEHHFYASIFYSINNPVKAGWVQRWQDWPHTYLHPTLADAFCP